jgi:hypothetical protein
VKRVIDVLCVVALLGCNRDAALTVAGAGGAGAGSGGRAMDAAADHGGDAPGAGGAVMADAPIADVALADDLRPAGPSTSPAAPA